MVEARLAVFDAFYTTKGINGTGLGLWISSRIMHRHKGYVRASSSTSPEHRGSVFTFWLPTKFAAETPELSAAL